MGTPIYRNDPQNIQTQYVTANKSLALQSNLVQGTMTGEARFASGVRSKEFRQVQLQGTQNIQNLQQINQIQGAAEISSLPPAPAPQRRV
jgi:hypothetical protein